MGLITGSITVIADFLSKGSALKAQGFISVTAGVHATVTPFPILRESAGVVRPSKRLTKFHPYYIIFY